MYLLAEIMSYLLQIVCVTYVSGYGFLVRSKEKLFYLLTCCLLVYSNVFSVIQLLFFLQNILWSHVRTPACLVSAGEMATVLVLETLCLFPVIWDTAWRVHQS